MSRLETKLDVTSHAFRTNVDFMNAYVLKVRGVEANILKSEEKYRDRASKRGKLLPRERLAHLLDPGAPFLELNSIAGYLMNGDTDGSSAGGNIIVGIGFVNGRRVLVMVWNYAIKGGTITTATTRKNLRLQEIAFQTRLPSCVRRSIFYATTRTSVKVMRAHLPEELSVAFRHGIFLLQFLWDKLQRPLPPGMPLLPSLLS